MKARPGIIPNGVMTKKKWDELCLLASQGQGYRRISRVMGLKQSTVVDYVRLLRAGLAPEWKKPEGPATKRLLDILAIYFICENVRKTHTQYAYTMPIRNLGRYLDSLSIAVSNMRPEHVRDLVDQYENPNTRKLYMTLYRLFFAWAVYRGQLGSDPTETLRVESEVIRPIKIFTDQELSAIYASCRTPLERVLISLYRYTGLRQSEVAHIELKNMDLERRILYVPYVKGGKSVRKPIPKTLSAEIQDYLAKTKIRCEYLIVFPEDHCYVKQRGKHLSAKRISIIVGRVLDRAITDTERRSSVSIHTFRHTYVTHNARNVGTSISHRKAFISSMGWTSERMLDRYLHIDEEADALSTEYVDKTFAGGGDEIGNRD